MASMPAANVVGGRRYPAFISYSHRDRRWAVWLHRALEAYRPPGGLGQDNAPRRMLRPIFLDRAELSSSSDLASSVRSALESADFLIVICSPAAAQSRWVNEEVRTFKTLGGAARILAMVVPAGPGQPRGAAQGLDDCLPPALRYTVDAAGVVTTTPVSEPLAADVRPGADDRRSAVLKIAAGLLDVPLDRLVQRDQARRQRRLLVLAGAAVLGCVIFASLSIVAVRSRNEAERQRHVAVQQSLTAERTAGFLKSLFAVSDPSEARGKSITAREVLDQGVRQIKTQLQAEPLVRAELTTTLGEVYTSLGLLREGGALVESAQAIPSVPLALSARQFAALGEVRFQEGDLPAAQRSLQRADLLLTQSTNADPAARVRVVNRLGDVYRNQGNYRAARAQFRESLQLANAPQLSDPSLRAAAEEGLAQCDLEEHHYAAAEEGFLRALDRQVAVTGEMHPRVSEILNELGSLRYLQGNRSGAAVFYKRTLEIDRQLLGDRHPDVTITMNNLARMLLETRQFAAARTLLEQSLSARSAQVVDTDSNMAFVLSNLALVEMGLGDPVAAKPLFERALRNATVNKHRLLGPILTDYADLECRTGDDRDGLARLATARSVVAERYPDDPWRVAHVDNVRAGCLTGLKRYAEAEPLVAASMPILLAKWPADTLYGYDALQRTMQLYSLNGNAAKLAQYRRLSERK